MKKLKNIFIVSVYLFISSAFTPKQKETILDFSLKNTNGKMVSMANYKDAKGFIIVFTCNHCPFAKLYPPRLNALNSKYGSLGVPLIAIS